MARAKMNRGCAAAHCPAIGTAARSLRLLSIQAVPSICDYANKCNANTANMAITTPSTSGRHLPRHASGPATHQPQAGHADVGTNIEHSAAGRHGNAMLSVAALVINLTVQEQCLRWAGGANRCAIWQLDLLHAHYSVCLDISWQVSCSIARLLRVHSSYILLQHS